MPSQKVLQEKEQIVAGIAEQFKTAVSGVFVDYCGLTVEEDTQLRNKFREAGVEYKVIKNSLTLRAAKEAGLKVKASAPSPEAPSMVKALDIYCTKMEEGVAIDDAVVKEDKDKEEFIRAQQSKLQKKSRTRTPKKEA